MMELWTFRWTMDTRGLWHYAPFPVEDDEFDEIAKARGYVKEAKA